MIVTIDGPVAGGKSSVARLVAAHYGWYYINSGLFFRLIAYVLLHEHGYTLERLAGITRAELDRCIECAAITYTYQNEQEDIAYRGKSLVPELKNPVIDQAASLVSTNGAVREVVLQLERALAQSHDLVIDGRDTGSIVFPHAQVKIYLTAEASVRAQRWQNVMREKGQIIDDAQALHEVKQRDERDTTRKIAPLVIPQGALIIDSTDKDIATVVARVVQAIQ